MIGRNTASGPGCILAGGQRGGTGAAARVMRLVLAAGGLLAPVLALTLSTPSVASGDGAPAGPETILRAGKPQAQIAAYRAHGQPDAAGMPRKPEDSPQLVTEPVVASLADADTVSLVAGKAVAEANKSQRPRLVVDATWYPFSAMGKLQVAGQSFCSGTLVGPSLVLTAGHCFYNKARQTWRPASDVHFVAGYQRSSFVAHGQAVRYVTPLTTLGKAPDASTLASDWALVELDRRIGDQVGWLGLARHDNETLEHLRTAPPETVSPLFLAAYREDRAHALSLQSPCRITRQMNRGAVVLNDCQVVHGSSGSPLVAWENGHFLVVGVTSAQVSFRDHPSETATVSTQVFSDPDSFGSKVMASWGLAWGPPKVRESTAQKGMTVLAAALADGPGPAGEPAAEAVGRLLRQGVRRDKVALPPMDFPELQKCRGDCAASGSLEGSSRPLSR